MADTHLITHATLDLIGGDYLVHHYTLTRQLFGVDRLSVEFAMAVGQVPPPAKVLGKDARLTVSRGSGKKLVFSGEVVLARTLRSHDDIVTLRVDVSPKLWRLSRRRNHRVFQKKTVKDIVEEVFTKAGVDSTRKWKLDGNHPKHDYVTQYNETDLEFIKRLLAEEGIYYATEDVDGHAIRLSDDPTGLDDLSAPSTLTYLPELGNHGAENVVTGLALNEKICSDKVTLRKFDWEHPGVDLTKSAEPDDDRAHLNEVYRYPARRSQAGEIKSCAEFLLDALRAERQVLTGDTTSLALRPGVRFCIAGHPYVRLNGKYLVTEMGVSGRGQHALVSGVADGKGVSTWRSTFVAIPIAKGHYRPKAKASMCQVPGLQTALTTGPSSDEIHTNEHGQVTVLFPWEQGKTANQNSSCWMRTSQMPLGGSMLLPRMKWEVAVSATEGDVDQRIVMSRLYNSETMPPYSLPDKRASMSLQTSTTPGGGSGNEVRMSDNKGEEEMFFNGSKDMTVNVGNNTTESVAVDCTTEIGSNHTLKVADSMMEKIGSNQSVTIDGDQKMTVKTLCADEIGGDHKLTIDGKRTMMIGGDHRRTVEGDSKETFNASRIEVVAGSVTDETMADMKQTVGTALIEVTNASRSLIAVANRSEKTGALKVILTKGGRGVEASTLAATVGGAVLNVVKGNRTVTSGSTLTEAVAGAQIIKAANVTFDAEATLSLTMGASTITLTPASVTIAGASVTIDSDSIDLGIILNN